MKTEEIKTWGDSREWGYIASEATPCNIVGFESEIIPAMVRYIYKDDQGRRCTQFVCTCRGSGRDNNADARFIAKAFKGAK